MELPSGAAAPGPGSESTRPQASFTGNSSRDKDGVEPAVVEQPPVERWQRCLGQKWTTKNVPTAITLTKTTLQKLFAWQYGSSKQHLPTVIFNLALTGGEVVQLPPVTLNAPSRDDTVRLQRVQQGQGSAKVDGYQVPADTMKQIYGLLGVGVLPGGQLKFVSEGWHDGCLVLRVSLEPAAAQQAPTAAAAAARTGMAAAAPVASASVAAAGPAARAGIAATAAAAAAAAAVAAAPPAAARFSTMAATPVAVPATAAATTGTAAAAPVGSAPSAGERAGMGAAAAATAGSEQEAQSLPAGEQHAQQAAPPPQHEQNQQQPHLAPDQQVAGPAMSNATPQPGVAGSSLEMLAATAAGQGGGTPAGQQAGVVVSPLPSSNITPYARIRWLKGEELHELLCRPKEHGLVDTTKTFEAKPGVGDLYLCDKGNTLWKAVGHKWGPHRSNAVLKVKGEDAVKVHYCKTLDGALEARWYTLVDEDAPNARLQLLHFYRPKQYASEDSKPGPKSKKRKAGSERNPGSAKRQAGPAVSQQQAAGSAAGPAAAQAASGGAQAQPSQQQAEQQAASMQVDPPEPQAERQQGQGEQQQGGQPPEQQAQQVGTQQPAEQEGGQPPEQQAQQVGIQQPAEQEGGQGQQQRGQSRDRCADQLHGQHEQQLSADPQRSQQQQDKQPSAQIPATVASQRAEADDWRQRCLEAETRCQGFEKEQQVMSAQVAAAKQAAQETQEKAIQLRAELEVVQAELREKRRALEAVQQRCQIAEDKQRQAASQLAAVQRELAAEQARRKVVECQLADSRSLVQTLEAGQQRSRDSDSKLLQELAEARAAAEEAASLRRQLKSVQQQLESACAAQQGSQLSSDAARAAAVDAAGPSPDRPTTFAALRRMLLECKVAPSSMQLFLKQQIFEADAEKVAMHWDYLAGCYRDGDDGGVRDWVQLYAA